jgi:putative zinc finger/helix-turn-helix YgiT family protein
LAIENNYGKGVKIMKCENCQNEMTLTKTQKYQYVESGLENVFLDNIEICHCAKCNMQIPVIPKIIKLHNTIGYAIVCENSLLSGAEIQFLRKNLRVKSQDWANLLRTDKSVYSRWENDSQSISSQSDLLIRYLYLRLLEEIREVRLEKKIAESLSITTAEKAAIIIDVEQIEHYSYLPFGEAIHLAEIRHAQTEIFDIELDKSNLFLSAIEKPLPFEKINKNPFTGSMAGANTEMALAA